MFVDAVVAVTILHVAFQPLFVGGPALGQMKLTAGIHSQSIQDTCMKKSFLALALVGLLCGNAAAVDKYWDINGTTADSSAGATAAGTWNAANLNWNTDATGGAGGALSGWNVNTDTAVFAAGANATGAYTVTVSGTQTVGGLRVEEGTVSLTGNAVALGTGTATINSGAKLIIPGSANITGSAGGKIVLDGGTLENTVSSAAGPSFVSGALVIELTANGGTLSVTNVLGPTILQTTPAPGTTITGPGALIKAGPGVLAIATVASHTGGTIINEGELRIRTTANRLPIAGAVTVNGTGVFNLNNVAQQIGSLSGNGTVGTGGATLTISGSTSTTFDGALKNIANSGAGGVTTGNGRLTKDGTGVLTLTNANNDLRGRITLINGGIIVAPGAKLSDAIADLYVDGGTLTLNNTAQTVENLTSTVAGTSTGTVVLGTGHTLTTDPVANTTFAAKITGAGALVKANVLSGATNRTLTLTGDNDYTGTTTISGGRIAVGHANALGSTAGDTQVASGATLLVDGAANSYTIGESVTIAGAGAGSDGGAITVQNSSVTTFTGPVTLAGVASLAVSGSATGTFSGAITASSNQNLNLQGGSGAGGGGTISGTINLGTGGLTKAEGGAWRLTGANTYSGGTVINGGTIYANNTTGSATGSGAISVNTGGTLAGTGAVAGAVNVALGGTLAPGASVESLSTGAVSLATGAILEYELDSSAALAAAADLVDANGTLTLAPGALLTVTDLAATSTALTAGTKFTVVSYTGAWDGGIFLGLIDGATLLVGANTFEIDYNDTDAGINFGGGTGSTFLTLTAVPEASAMLFGGLACCAAGVGAWRRRKA
jgi:fibronectin-binding autotransporter adhesin